MNRSDPLEPQDEDSFFNRENREIMDQQIALLREECSLWQQEKKQPFRSIGIIGMGLIGGSIAKAIKSKDPFTKIHVLRREDKDIHLAKEAGVIDEEHPDLPSLLQQVEILILATPLQNIISYAREIGPIPPKKDQKQYILDVGSVKSEIASLFAALSHPNREYIPSHPMAGKEKGSFCNSQARLFLKTKWILTPHAHTTEESVQKISQFICFLGAEPLILSPMEHDRYAALVSHIPYVIAKQYSQFVEKTTPQALSIAGPGYHSFMRLAKDNEEMRKQISQYNAAPMKEIWDEWSTFCTPSLEEF